MAEPPSRLRPGRPRSQATRQHILDTALQMAYRDGFAALTIDGLSRAAGVGKPTIYRWWPSKSFIVFDALQQYANESLPLPEGDTLAARLDTFLQAMFTALNGPIGALLKSLMAEAQNDPAFAELFRTHFIAVRRQAVLTLLRDAQAQGQLGVDVDIEVLADAIYGAMWYRLLIAHAPLDAPFAHALVRALV